MKYRILICLWLLTFVNINLISQSDTVKSVLKYEAKIDTLRIQSIENARIKKWYENTSTPWIVSLIIALVSVGVNLIISYSTRKTTLESVKTQIENTTRLASLQYTSTLNSTNRQEWINDVRHCITDFITQCKLLNAEFQESEQNKERKNNLHEKVSYNRNKLRLLLSPQIPQHTNFLNSMKELLDILDRHLNYSIHNTGDYDNFEFLQKSDTVIDVGRELIYFEWQKIQNVSFK